MLPLSTKKPRHFALRAIARLFLALFCASCSESPAEEPPSTPKDPRPLPSPVSSALVVAADAPKPVAVDLAAREKTWKRLFAHLASHCYVDELSPTNYAVQWLNHHLPREQAPAGAPWPSLLNKVFPDPQTPQAQTRADELRKEWLGNPKSHVVDCYFEVAQRDDPSIAPKIKEAHYAAYLPAALFVTPERVRAALLYSPGGGRGGHSRPFLTEIPGKTIYDIAAGGLGSKHRIDQWLLAHPQAAASIFFALHSNGEEYGNSATAFLTEDVPSHIAQNLLGGIERQKLLLGVEGVSSGARTLMLALRAKPDAFVTVGLSCMACGGVDARKGRIGSAQSVNEWASALGERAKRGELQMRFAIGSRDNQLPCNKALHELLAKAGVFNLSQPQKLHECKEGAPEDERSCDQEIDGFRIYRGELHDYHFLSRSWQAQLEFHLDALSEMQSRQNR